MMVIRAGTETAADKVEIRGRGKVKAVERDSMVRVKGAATDMVIGAGSNKMFRKITLTASAAYVKVVETLCTV